MALIKSTILAQISGSINGMTFAHNRGGAYARNRSLPSNPGTDRQDQVRTAMASISKAWGSVLDESQREAWRIFGSQQQVQNRIGDTITLSGIAAFNRMNLFRMSTLGEEMVEDPPLAMGSQDPPPTFIGVNGVTSLEETPAVADIVMNTSSTGYSVAVYYAGPIKPGIKYYRGPYIGHTTSVVTASPVSVTLTDLVMPSDDINAALKITLYDTANSLPIWTVFTDPFLIPVDA
jgi:hypothetical protein